ncbi:MAG TPA: hypothetical protein VGM86_13705 [Thermoanaerobaculia bacterium]|jgi:tetratricopeptide (TPR) repeat protein
MQPSNSDWPRLITIILQHYPGWSILLFLLLVISAAGFIFLLLRERFSRRARDIAEAGKLMSDSLRENTESLASIPQIVESFTELVEKTVDRKVMDLDGKISTKVADQLSAKAEVLIQKGEEAAKILAEARDMKESIAKVKAQVEEQQGDLSAQAQAIKAALPDYERWKDIADPELLIRRLSNTTSWEEAKDLLARIENLVETSGDHPEQIPAKFIEVSGDYCRNHNQFPKALWFYEQAVTRDPDRLTAMVELYSLRAEYVPSRRAEALSKLEEIALSKRIRLATLRRIFNVLIEINRYDLLIEMCTKLLEVEFYQFPLAQGSLYRNRAVARASLNQGMKTEEAWADLKKAYELAPSDQNNLTIFADWLIETEKYQEASEKCLCLLKLDPSDINFYILLSRALSGAGRHNEALAFLDKGEEFAADELDKIKLAEVRLAIQHTLIGAELSIPSRPESLAA